MGGDGGGGGHHGSPNVVIKTKYLSYKMDVAFGEIDFWEAHVLARYAGK